MTFPNAHSQIYRNEAGEVLGWDNTSYDEPEYCDTCGFNHSGDCQPEDLDEDEIDHDRLEAVCYKCGETFIPDSPEDLIHQADVNGHPCGGIGSLL